MAAETKQDTGKKKEEIGKENHLQCQVCARTMRPEACSWEEDGTGGMCCPDCRAERESCGCSD